MEYNVFQNNKLLDLVNTKLHWNLYKLTEIFTDDTKNAKKIKKENYLKIGKYPIIDQGQSIIAGYTNEEENLYNNYPIIIFGDHTRIIKYVDKSIFIGADGVKLLKPLLSKDKLSVKYVYYFLNTVELPNDGYSRHFKYLKEVIIPVPKIEIQQKIVNILDKAQSLIDKRKAEIEDLDELVKSRFIEMFGDLSKNNKGWQEVELSKVCSVIHRYPTFYGMDYIEEGIPVIRIGNILRDGILEDNMENYIFVYDDVNKDFPLTTIELGDILMAVRGDGSAAKRIGIVTTEKLIGANISPNLLRIKAKENSVNNVYLFWYLISDIGQRRLDAYVNKTAKKNIAAKDIKKVVTPVPPLELQNQFADFVKQVDKLKLEMEKSLKELEDNFNSLMQKAFKGELFN
ncbi:restriction endonuclease subunit S [Clostridium botulinum]|uniref:restriction endonuclease subunit S n=1 Tax=Clostridium botulinum TaxID=1491 RepID=UPI0009B46FBB|nr:restriction endonuclease subunit S [Clostridium botulinum]NFJ67996.1 restriction endonuclease subunit S [Clostridium botulinum]NFR45355.1 restriction endonuclease subunit S [Clostridium botulinum]RKF11898.1 restriction endonuclease subunit S [Clostridium botulinum]